MLSVYVVCHQVSAQSATLVQTIIIVTYQSGNRYRHGVWMDGGQWRFAVDRAAQARTLHCTIL